MLLGKLLGVCNLNSMPRLLMLFPRNTKLIHKNLYSTLSIKFRLFRESGNCRHSFSKNLIFQKLLNSSSNGFYKIDISEKHFLKDI